MGRSMEKNVVTIIARKVSSISPLRAGMKEKKRQNGSRGTRKKNAATLTVENTTTIKAVKRGAAKNGFEHFFIVSSLAGVFFLSRVMHSFCGRCA
jgi:hypothetical protein